MKESNVKSYCNAFPKTFSKAKNEFLYSNHGEKYIDFFSGAGTLNYGHNNEYIKKQLITYIQDDYITHGLDFSTIAKNEFMEIFSENILKPSGLDYLVQFPSPSGTNANEAALKLAKKFTNRRTIFSFTGGFHGMSEASLAITGNSYFRNEIPMSSNDVVFMPYESGFIPDFNSIAYIEHVLSDTSSGVDIPAAMILETVQAEGGINVASDEWLKNIRRICDQYGILMICDDVQVGCGRVGEFFSFEKSGIVPDIVTLSKSISGYGLPLAMVLFRPELDCWKPAQHNGTFRGNQHAFVTAKAALELRKKIDIKGLVEEKSTIIFNFLNKELAEYKNIKIRGRGMIIGIDLGRIDGGLASKVSKSCFEQGLIVECAGRNDEVIKVLPPLVISEEVLVEGLAIIVSTIKGKIDG